MSTRVRIALDEMPWEIIIPNPGGRICTVAKEQSGWNSEQIFTSKVLPEKIRGIYISELAKKMESPVYRLEVMSKKLILQGWYGYKNGTQIMDRICHDLLSVEGTYYSRSINKTDFDSFEHTGENVRYWLATRCEKEHGLYRAYKGNITNCTLFDPDGYEEDYADNIMPIIVINIDANIST